MYNKKNGIGLATAIRGLTRFCIKGNDSKKQSTALYWYPIVGLFLSLIAIAPVILINLLKFNSIYCLNTNATLLEAAIIVSLLAYGSRGFHLDGLADTFDGFGGAYTKENVMRIMKDSRVGSFGVTVLIIVIMLKTIALSIVIEHNILITILFVMVSRSSASLQCYISKYAKEKGLAKQMCDNTKISHILINLFFIIIASYIFLLLGYFRISIAVFVTMFLTTIIIHKISKKRIGGITGDILGCNVEVVESVCMVVTAFILI